MKLSTIVIVENKARGSDKILDFPAIPPTVTSSKSTAVLTEITDVEDAAYTEAAGIPPGCLPKGHEESIDLSLRRLECFPVNLFAKCVHLTFLFLQDNLIEHLQKELFSTFPLLRRLDVRRNKLTTIPEEIGDHRALEVLLLQDNKISILPPHLGHCRTLRNLQLQGNPVSWPVEDIVNQGIEQLLAYLRENDKCANDLEENGRKEHNSGRNATGNQKKYDGSGDQEANPNISSTNFPLTMQTGLNLAGGDNKVDYSKGPKNSPATRSKSKTNLLRRKSSQSFNVEDQATLLGRRGQFPLGYQKRMSNVPPHEVYDSLRHRLWNDILRQEMLLQDYLLQKRRDIETLKEWRHKTRLLQLLPKVEHRSTIVPFDSDETLQMMNWRELINARNQSLEKKGPSKPGPFAVRAPDPTEKIIKLLQDIDKLKEESIKTAAKPDELSQHQYGKILSTQIDRLRELQKTIRSIGVI